MKKIVLPIVLMLCCLATLAQDITLTFTGRDTKNQYVKLDRVEITNQTQNWQETLIYPDTILMMGSTGISDVDNANGFKLSQNVPNPFDGTTDFSLQMPEAGKVLLEVYDMSGRKISVYQNILPAGMHSFRVLLSTAQSCLLRAVCGNEVASIKMVNQGQAGENAIRYMGEGYSYQQTPMLKNGSKSSTDNPFVVGDSMRYVGYAIVEGKEGISHICEKQQMIAETIVLQFDTVEIFVPEITTDSVYDITETSAVCGGNIVSDGGTEIIKRGVCWSTEQSPTIADSVTADGGGLGSFTSSLTGLDEGTTYYVRAYATNRAGTAYGEVKSFSTLSSPFTCGKTITDVEKNKYQTVRIGEQCWMKENLKTTKYADGTEIKEGNTTSNELAYWYFPDDTSANKEIYGLLYNWKAVMRDASSSSANPSGVQGICPEDWHVPSDAEWTQLTTYLGSQSEFVCGDNSEYVARALADTIGWIISTKTNMCVVGFDLSANNASGFSARPAGYRYGIFVNFGNFANFWSTTIRDISGRPYYRYLDHDVALVARNDGPFYGGMSVRCIHD